MINGKILHVIRLRMLMAVILIFMFFFFYQSARVYCFLRSYRESDMKVTFQVTIFQILKIAESARDMVRWSLQRRPTPKLGCKVRP